MRKMTTCLAVMLGAGLAIGSAGPVKADAVSDFYKGKRLKLLIGFGTGGGYNLYARHVARHMGRHIPGDPSFIAQNMPGAGSIRLTNHLFNKAPKDGTEIGMVSQAIPLSQLLNYKGFKADLSKFNWIGNASVSNGVTSAWHTRPFKTLEDVKKNEMVVPASGGRSTSTIIPRVLNAILGTKFKIIQGFSGAGQMNLAIERGEVDGRASNTLASWNATAPDWVANKKLVHLVQFGLKSDPRIADVPLAHTLTTNKDDQAVLRILSSLPAIGRPIAAPPGVPAERVAALRKAFDDTMTDAAYIAEAKKLKMELNPMGGAELADVITKVMATPQSVVDKFKIAVKYGKTYKCKEVMKDLSRCRKAKKKKKKKKAS
ncbi:MAG: tripartite tricarboxylate transporter substrate-binding protein [Alphaproteobacteria bacterium]|nr:tripartite tricarboxylate transporter substrate-binding protein [Alphaproteobacteria bacterium]